MPAVRWQTRHSRSGTRRAEIHPIPRFGASPPSAAAGPFRHAPVRHRQASRRYHPQTRLRRRARWAGPHLGDRTWSDAPPSLLPSPPSSCFWAPNSPAPPRRRDGTTACWSATYTINVPPDWNGGLVMFAHGYEGEGSGNGTVRNSPLDAHLAERRYAWAASGYRAWGYRPDWFLLDLLTLRAHFINRFGLAALDDHSR